MALKSGQLIHVMNRVLLHRAQTAGPGTVTINREKIRELGNYQAVGSVTDIPDLSFNLESFDTSAELEAILTGAIDPVSASAGAYGALADGTAFNLAKAKPMDVASVFKPGQGRTNEFDEIGSVAIPYLTLESMSYRFGISDNATQNATLRGDTLLYTPGSTYIETFTGPAYTLANPAFPYNGDVVAGTRYALSVMNLDTGERLSYGSDYTETVTGTTGARGVALAITHPGVAADTRMQVIYASDTVAVYPQASHALVEDTDPAHPAPRPAAIRGRSIEVFVGGVALTNRWNSVQSVNIDWRVNLDRDEEFGNSSVVAQDFDVPDVTGSVEIKPRDYAELYRRVREISGVPDGEVVGPLTATPLNIDIVLHNPDITPARLAAGESDVLKTFRIPDARFSFPGFQGRVQQKLTTQMEWTSDTGVLEVFKGSAPAI